MQLRLKTLPKVTLKWITFPVCDQTDRLGDNRKVGGLEMQYEKTWPILSDLEGGV